MRRIRHDETRIHIEASPYSINTDLRCILGWIAVVAIMMINKQWNDKYPCSECGEPCYRLCYLGSRLVCVDCFGQACEKIEIARTEKTRLAEEKDNTVLRLIDYNNRRIMRGLRPVDYMEAQ